MAEFQQGELHYTMVESPVTFVDLITVNMNAQILEHFYYYFEKDFLKGIQWDKLNRSHNETFTEGQNEPHHAWKVLGTLIQNIDKKVPIEPLTQSTRVKYAEAHYITFNYFWSENPRSSTSGRKLIGITLRVWKIYSRQTTFVKKFFNKSFKIKVKMAPNEADLRIIHFDEPENYAVWLIEHGYTYCNIEILSINDGITIKAWNKNNLPELLNGRLFTRISKKYSNDVLLTLPIEGMIIDALDKRENWDVVLKMMKLHDISLALSIFYRLWKDDFELFEKIKKKEESGWGNINNAGAAFLCTLTDQDEDFVKIVFATGNVPVNYNTLAHAVHCKSQLFLKYAFTGLRIITPSFLMSVYNAGFIDMIPKCFSENLTVEGQHQFLQFLIFSDTSLVIKLIPKTACPSLTHLVVTLRCQGKFDEVDKLAKAFPSLSF